MWFTNSTVLSAVRCLGGGHCLLVCTNINIARTDVDIRVLSPSFTIFIVIAQICLSPTAPTQYHFLLVRGLLIIINQKKISWWPKIDVVYSKGAELRKMFSDTMQSVTMTMNHNRVPPPQVRKKTWWGFPLKH